MNNIEIKEITVQKLKELMESNSDFQLIDVRNKDEYDYCEIGGELIPMPEIADRIDEIAKDKMVIIHCHHGGRSKKVIDWLQANYEFNNLYNLQGGIHSWSIEIDPNVAIY